MGKRMIARINRIAARTDVLPIGDIRGLGAMVAFELVKAPGSVVPDPDAAKALCARALENGLILLSCGVYANVIRILVPLTAEDTVLEEGLDMLEKSLSDLAVGRAAAE